MVWLCVKLHVPLLNTYKMIIFIDEFQDLTEPKEPTPEVIQEDQRSLLS